MSDFVITIEVPEELVERAKRAGVQIDNQVDDFINLIEEQIRKREAANAIREIAERIQAVPAELRPSPEEIEVEIRAYWAEKDAQDKA